MKSDEPKYLGFPEKNFVIESFGVESDNLPIEEMNDLNVSNSRLQKIIADSENDLHQYYYPNGPIIGLGSDVYGTLVVQINKDEEVNRSQINDMYQSIKKNGEKNGIKNIPCKFLSVGIMKIEST